MSSRELLVGYSGQAAIGVLHDHDCLNAQHLAGQGQTPENVVGHSTSGVSDHMDLTEVQPEYGEDVNPRIHARDHSHPATRARICDVGPGGGVSLVRFEKFDDLVHG